MHVNRCYFPTSSDGSKYSYSTLMLNNSQTSPFPFSSLFPCLLSTFYSVGKCICACAYFSPSGAGQQITVNGSAPCPVIELCANIHIIVVLSRCLGGLFDFGLALQLSIHPSTYHTFLLPLSLALVLCLC